MEKTNKKPNVLKTQVGGNHYAKYPIQPIEYIQANGLDFAQGNIVKLATRFRDKGGAEDLRKAKQYADFLLALEYGEDVKAAEPAKEPTPAQEPQEGIYLIYDDGRAELFTGTNGQDGVKYVGVSFRGVRFAVSLTETDAQLLPDGQKATKRKDSYKNECEAIYDFDSAGNTAKLVQDNPALAELLKDGEAIPALGVLVIIRYLREGLNKALDYVGGHLLTDNDYWSSTENSEYSAWNVYFGIGNPWNYNKYFGYAVRAVAAF